MEYSGDEHGASHRTPMTKVPTTGTIKDTVTRQIDSIGR